MSALLKRNEEEHARKEAERKEAEKKTKRLNENKTSTDDTFAAPKYVIKHRCQLDMQDFVAVQTDVKTMNRPTTLVVEIDLPLLRSAAPVTLDIFESRLALVSHEPAKYKWVER